MRVLSSKFPHILRLVFMTGSMLKRLPSQNLLPRALQRLTQCETTSMQPGPVGKGRILHDRPGAYPDGTGQPPPAA